MKIQLCSATKNTFLFVEETQLQNWQRKSKYSQLTRSELARILCANLGSSADGFVVVKRIPNQVDLDYEWDFFNNDGSSAEMCGNAARCMAYFVTCHLAFQKKEVHFQTLAGPIWVKCLEDKIYSVRMPSHQIKSLWARESIPRLGEVSYCFINTGVPHAVIETTDLNQNTLLPLVNHFRFKESFGPAGANVSFFTKVNEKYEGLTFERGVEGFTASCGTGVVAMALAILAEKSSMPDFSNEVSISTPGGQLMVALDPSEKFCWLIGPAGLDEEVEIIESYF